MASARASCRLHALGLTPRPFVHPATSRSGPSLLRPAPRRRPGPLRLGPPRASCARPTRQRAARPSPSPHIVLRPSSIGHRPSPSSIFVAPRIRRLPAARPCRGGRGSSTVARAYGPAGGSPTVRRPPCLQRGRPAPLFLGVLFRSLVRLCFCSCASFSSFGVPGFGVLFLFVCVGVSLLLARCSRLLF